MSLNEDIMMRLIVMFDLPVSSKKERKEASMFRKFLQRDGFIMMQYSVYMRICKGDSALTKHKKRIRKEIPSNGHIRVFHITDLQYLRMEVWSSTKKVNHDTLGDQLLLL